MAEKLSADELEKLAGAATARPWYALEEIAEYEGFEISSPAQHCISTYEDDTCDAVAWMGPGGGGDEKENAANAAFIVYLANHATDLAAATAAREQAEKWQWRFSDKLIQDEKCHDWGELFAEVVKLASRAEISEADAKAKDVPLPDSEPSSAGVWYDREEKRWAFAAFRPTPVGNTYERLLALWEITDDGCDPIGKSQRKGQWVKVTPPPPPPASEPLSRSRLKREAVQRGEELPSFAPAEASEPVPPPTEHFRRWQEIHACDVCGNVPDAEGVLEHGRGCFVEEEDGGGVTFVGDFKPASEPTAADAANEIRQHGGPIEPIVQKAIDSATAELRAEVERLQSQLTSKGEEVEKMENLEMELRNKMLRLDVSLPVANAIAAEARRIVTELAKGTDDASH